MRGDPAISHILKDQIRTLWSASSIPGLGMAVIENGGVAWTTSLGVKNTATAEPVTDETIFHACSISKPISAFLALTLWSRGELDLDEGIGRHLDIVVPFDAITPRQILCHTGGLPNWYPDLTRRLKGGNVLRSDFTLAARQAGRTKVG